MFTIHFGTATKKKNSTKIEAVGDGFPCLLLDNTSIIRPVFKIRWDNPSVLFGYNYCYVPEFKRYYFITDIVSENSVVFLIQCECDVLATFRDGILKTEAFVQYSASNRNASIIDNRIPKLITSTVSANSIFDIPELTSAGSFALTLASAGSGEVGCATTYLLNSSQMASVAERLYDPSFLQQAIDYFTNPMDAVISCTWTPVTTSAGSAGSSTIEIGGQAIGSGNIAKKVVEGKGFLHLTLKYIPNTVGDEIYADYRNVEPYAEHYIFFPGVGLQQIPILKFIGAGTKQQITIPVSYAVSPCTGAITYKIYSEDAPENPAMVVTGNMGVSVPVSAKSTGYAPAVANLATTIGRAAVTLAIPEAKVASIGMLAAGAISTAIQSNVETSSVSGSLGGWATEDSDFSVMRIFSRYYDLSENPLLPGFARTIGKPLFAVKVLDTVRGYVQCVGAHVETWATKEETDMISMYLNNYGTQPYGGCYIE